MALEETRGPKCDKREMQYEHNKEKLAVALPSHVEAISGDGTTKELKKVIYDV